MSKGTVRGIRDGDEGRNARSGVQGKRGGQPRNAARRGGRTQEKIARLSAEGRRQGAIGQETRSFPVFFGVRRRGRDHVRIERGREKRPKKG